VPRKVHVTDVPGPAAPTRRALTRNELVTVVREGVDPLRRSLSQETAELRRELERRDRADADLRRELRHRDAAQLVDAAIEDCRIGPGERDEWLRRFELVGEVGFDLAKETLERLRPRVLFSAADLAAGQDDVERARIAHLTGSRIEDVL
jgi:hypothetical protein